MKMLSKSHVEKLPKVRMSLEKIQEKIGSNCSVSVLCYYDYPLLVWCFCSVCEQYFYYNKSQLIHNKSCPVCNHKIVIPGYNDLATKRPDLIKYLKNPEDGYKYMEHSNQSIMCQCKLCGYEKSMVINSLSYNDFNCPFCTGISSNRLVVGVNDIATKASWVIPYLKNKNDAYRYSWRSNEKTWFVCLICKKEYCKRISVITKFGFNCPCCSDTVSYPNKFVRSFLKQLPISDLEFEFNRDWTNGRFYDNYFTYQNKEYLVEADGGYHFKHNQTNRIAYKEQRRIDKLKDNIAKTHGMYMIRLDCSNPTGNHIMKSIQQSVLAKIFDLSTINWEQCHLDAIKNIAYEICCEYSKNERTLIDIAKDFGVSYSAAKSYIRKGKKAGIVSTENSGFRTWKIKKDNRKAIGSVSNLQNEQLFVFYDYIDAAEKLNAIDPEIKATKGSLWSCGTKNKSQIFKKKYKLNVFQKGLNYEQSYKKVSGL